MNSKNTKFHFPANKVHMKRYALFLIFLGLAAHFLLPQIASFEKTMGVVKQMKKWIILLVLLAQVVSYIGNGFLLHAIAKIYQQKLSVGLGAVIITAAGSVGLVAGGLVGSTLAILRWTRKQKIDMRTATLSSLLPSLLNTALITILSIFGLIHLLIVHELTTPQIITFSIILFLLSALIGVIVWGSNHQQQFSNAGQNIFDWLAARFHRNVHNDSMYKTIESSFKTWEEIRHNKWQLPLLGAAINVVFDMLTLYLVFTAANHPLLQVYY